MLSLPTPDRERELRRLTRALNLADRYRLHFAQSDVGEPRRRLIAELQAVVEGPIDVVELNSEIEHLRMHLSERYGEGEWPRVVMVTGIENWLPAGVDGESSPFVQNLNASRDLFRKLLRGPMVIWGAEHVLRAIQHGVPDFFSVASGLYLFPGEASAPLRSLETPGATFSEVARRLEELAELDERLPRLRESDREDRARLLARKVTLLTELARFSEAEAPMREALALAEGLPEASPTVALVLNECAQLLKATNRLREAEPLMRRALEIDQANHGSDHPNVARDLNNLAQLLKATNRLGEAEPLMRRALEIDQASYGTDHPNVAIRLNNLASLLHATNRLGEAEPLMRRALEIDQASYGMDHPTVAIRLNNLAALLLTTNRLGEAEPLMRRALEIVEASYGKDHPNVARHLNNLAQLLKATNRLGEAEPLMRPLSLDP